MGDYDVNVINKAIQDRGYTVRWFDKRISPSLINFVYVFGFIINTRSKMAMTTPVSSGHHWACIRSVGSTPDYVLFDSSKAGPVVIGGAEELVAYLNRVITVKEGELLIVAKPEHLDNLVGPESSS
eukprot:TRINITY_DN132_c0_g1_i3.p1 TRINITY_DN132_c0_g1~~TRINITY_DN132_c0_g1_i3.p1  ORF type:complete len:126 (-),score=16.79 TRINITY_DN132_c0_g1_i3:195-572(-)